MSAWGQLYLRNFQVPTSKFHQNIRENCWLWVPRCSFRLLAETYQGIRQNGFQRMQTRIRVKWKGVLPSAIWGAPHWNTPKGGRFQILLLVPMDKCPLLECKKPRWRQDHQTRSVPSRWDNRWHGAWCQACPWSLEQSRRELWWLPMLLLGIYGCNCSLQLLVVQIKSSFLP